MGARTMRWVGASAIVVLGLTAGASTATAGWSRLSLPTGRVPTPYQVSCASQRACFALAMYQRDPFVLYTGTHATRLAGPRVDEPAELNALACPSATACFVVGTTQRSANHGLLALRWRTAALVGDAPSRPAWPVADGQHLSAQRIVVPIDADVHRHR